MKKAGVDAERVFMHNNYFALFEIEPSFHINLNELERRYINLSKKFHPDVNDGKIYRIVDINKAYKTLLSPLTRAEYLLDLFNVEAHIDLEVLHESMEIREYLLDCGDFQDIAKIVDQKINNCMQNLETAFATSNLNDAAVQVIRLKYLYKSSDEIKKNVSDPSF
jgi:molecular chaperone HscB